MKKAEYRNVGNHVEDLADGRMIAPGETIELTEDEVRDPRFEDLLAREVFIGTDKAGEHEAQLAETRTKRRQTREADAEGEEAQ